MKKLAITGDSSEPMETLSTCSENWPQKQEEEMRIWQNSIKLPSSNCTNKIQGMPSRHPCEDRLTISIANYDAIQLVSETALCVDDILRIPHMVQGVTQTWFQQARQIF
jgi:hypothetical protein